MPDSALDLIVEDLRSSGSKYFPQHSDVKTARVVGHTPKPDHYTYEIVLESPCPVLSLCLPKSAQTNDQVPGHEPIAYAR